MPNITHQIGISTPAGKVFEALTTTKGLSGWWTETTTGTASVGGTINFEFRKTTGEVLGSMDFEVVELIKDKLVRWICKKGPEEWIGTEVRFVLETQGDFTTVKFSHRNWKEECDFIYHCSMKWAVFLLSLREYVAEGKGQPSPHDLKIDAHN